LSPRPKIDAGVRQHDPRLFETVTLK